jgi:glycosyltransferase involved in cell wall biosynthesis
VGGKPPLIRRYEERAASLGIADRVDLLGPRPVDSLASLLRQADILVSPRTHGTNTPMKVYSYMDSGRAILATRIPAHTQVFDDGIAMLVQPEPEAFGQGLLRLLSDVELRTELGRRAAERARLEHSRPAFRRKLLRFYSRVARRIGAKSTRAISRAS